MIQCSIYCFGNLNFSIEVSNRVVNRKIRIRKIHHSVFDIPLRMNSKPIRPLKIDLDFMRMLYYHLVSIDTIIGRYRIQRELTE